MAIKSLAGAKDGEPILGAGKVAYNVVEGGYRQVKEAHWVRHDTRIVALVSALVSERQTPVAAGPTFSYAGR